MVVYTKVLLFSTVVVVTCGVSVVVDAGKVEVIV